MARCDGEVGAGQGVEVGAPLGQDAPQLGMVALAGALLPGGQRVAVEDPAAALAGLEAAALDGEGVGELAPAVGEEWIGYIFLDDFGRTKPAFLNSTGVMYPSVECILKLLYQCT